jgi:histidinol-phosphate aminotransferase
MPPLSRRQFARTAAGAGLALAAPATAAARPSLPHGERADAIQLNSNENPYGPSEAALAAVAAAPAGFSRYPDAAETRLLAAIARRHAVAPENVVLGCGSGEVLRMADGAFLGPDRTVVVCEPTFEAVLNYARVTRAEAVRVPQTADFRHDLAAMGAACDARTGLVYVCNPNNPTGTIVSRDELAAFLGRVPPTAALVVDEAYEHFVDDERYGSAMAWATARPNVVVVRTFSKIYGLAGLRLGYAVSTAENVRRMRAFATWDNANAAALAAAEASLGDDAHVDRERRRNVDTRRWLEAALRRDGRRAIPSHTNFVMIDVGGDVGPVIAAFRQRGILVGRRFPSMPTWLRVSIGTPEEMRAFVAALRVIVPSAGQPLTGPAGVQSSPSAI